MHFQVLCVKRCTDYSLVVFPVICIIHLESLPISRELKGRTRTATFTEAPAILLVLRLSPLGGISVLGMAWRKQKRDVKNSSYTGAD